MAREGNPIKNLFKIFIFHFIRKMTMTLLKNLFWTMVTGDWSEALSILFETLLDSESEIQKCAAPERENARSTLYEETMWDLNNEWQVEREHLNNLFNREMNLLSRVVFNRLRARGIPFEDEEDVEQALDAVMSRGPELDRELDSTYVRQVRESIVSGHENPAFWDRLRAEVEVYAELRRNSPYWRQRRPG